MTDAELFATIRDRLFTAVIGDVMDKAGMTRQFLPPEIRAIDPDTVLVGRAMPVLVEDVSDASGAGDAYGVMFRALDELKSGRDLPDRRRLARLRALGWPHVDPCHAAWRGRRRL